MKKIFSFTKKKKQPSGTPDNGSVLSVGYELKDKDLGKVHKAASAGDLAKLKQLARKNDINQLDKENRTALHIACAGGNGEVVQFLVESKAKLDLCDNQNRSALMKAVQGQHERCVNILLENHANPNLVDVNSNSALHLAANIPAVSTAALLLQYDAKINAQNKDGFTPLSVAVREDHMEMAEFLLKEGGDVNLIDHSQRSPLMIAASNGQISMVRLLLRFDADITLKDTNGYSADDYAVMNRHHPCSHLIIEHGTQRNDGASHHGLSKKKEKLLGSHSQDVEAGFSFGGPATDRDEHGANEAGRDFDDNSQSESLSRVSKSAADEWPSSEDEDESSSAQKKQFKVKMMASKKREVSALPGNIPRQIHTDTSLRATESERECENRVQRIPSHAEALSSVQTVQSTVDPPPVSLPCRAPQMTSTPLPNYRKKEKIEMEQSDDEDDDDNDVDDDDEENYVSDDQLENAGEFIDATLTFPEAKASKDMKRDFLSELGLENGEEVQDTWSSEHNSEISKVSHEKRPSLQADNQERMTTSKEEMTEIGNDNDGDDQVKDNLGDSTQKEMERARFEPVSLLNKLKGDAVSNTDLMEELGLGDVDDLEDASDWDSTSTTSRRTLPDRRVTTPGLEEFPESSNSLTKNKDRNTTPPASLMSQKSVDSDDKSNVSTSPVSIPHPQPRRRKNAPLKPESEEDSDWDSVEITPGKLTETHTPLQLQNVANSSPMAKLNSPKPSPRRKNGNSASEVTQQQQQADKETPESATDVHIASGHEGAGEVVLKEIGSEKPEIRSGSLASQVAHQQQQQMATKSTNRDSVHSHHPVKQSCDSSREQTGVVEENLSPEPVKEAQQSSGPQISTRVNGDPLAVFDDSTLSDVSDDEGRLPAVEQHNIKSPSSDLEMAEDFDELTQSSDTATDDIDSPTSGYRHASLLIEKLDLPDLDSRTKVKIQNIFHEYERTNQKMRSRCEYEGDKVRQLEMEKTELKSNLEEVKDMKSALERNQLELQTEVTNLKFHLKQEQENRRNSTMMYNTSRDKLRRMEEQHELEVQERQKVELTIRNQELEMRTLMNNMKQLEEDHSETQRLLAQERSARSLQENLLSNHLRKQQEIEDENKRHMSKNSEALSQLSEASDRERELIHHNATLQEQLTAVKAELESVQANSSLKESHHLDEKEALKEQLEDTRRDLKLSNDALTQTVFSCESKITSLKSELTVTTNRLESERQSREALEAEVESTRVRLAGAVKEADLCQAARTDVEKSLLREKEEHQRLKDKLSDGTASQREAISSLSQKLAKAEARANSMENEVHRVLLQLTEKTVLLEIMQRDKDQASARVKEMETALQAEKEVVSLARTSQDALKERLTQSQSEGMLLRQQLEESQNKGIAKDRAVTDARELFSDVLSKVRSDCEERVLLIEDRNKELISKVADQREQMCKMEEEKDERESTLRQLQQELADSLKRMSMSEASLEVNTRYRNELEEEKARLLKDQERLKGKLQQSEDQSVHAERLIISVKSNLSEKEAELASATQKMKEVLSASAASKLTITQLEEALQRLEIENARLEAAAKQQFNKIDSLQKGSQEAALVRGRLEDLVTNLQSSKMCLEEQLSREVQKQSMLTHTAKDSQALWEEEVKGRSKLGLRLADLEKEKGELSTQMEIERKKAKKISEQKKAIDARLDQEMKRNTELQKEMYRLRILLKTAKKKLQDRGEAGGSDRVSPTSSLRVDMARHAHPEGGFGRMTDKVEDLLGQLEKEASRRSQLEKVNSDLKDQVASLKGLNRSKEQLERSKRQLEEEVLDLRRRMEVSQVEHSQIEHYRRDAEEKARQEVQQKLEQVNFFLQSQAASQEALDQMKAANEASLRSQLEQKIRELEGELGRARSTQQDSLNHRESTRNELDRYRQLYTEELRLRKSLAAKLERANNRLDEANSKLLNERSRSLITSNIANGSFGGTTLDFGSLTAPANYGATLGSLNRSLSLGFPLFSSTTDGQSGSVEDYLAKLLAQKSVSHLSSLQPDP